MPKKSPRAVGGSNSDEWYTSKETLAAARDFACVSRFTLDVAACEEAHVCDEWFGEERNGLALQWDGDVFCNPPFSQCGRWVAKAWEEWNAGRPTTITMLLPANRTETAWWQGYVEPFRDFVVYPLRTRFLPGRAAFAFPGSKGAVKKGSTFGIVFLNWRPK